MTALISLLVLASFVVSSINTISGYDPGNINDTIAVAIDKNDTKIYFYNNDISTNNGTIVDITDQEAVQNTSFSNTKQTFFIIHGWKSNASDDFCTTVRDALLQTDDVNVFIVDWRDISQQLYILAYASVEPLGKLLATMIQELVSNNGLDLEKTAMVGHSLGAHIAGVTGTALEGACDYIVGLDPAGPFFYDSINNRIAPTSAKFVQITHTCGSVLGFYKPLGLADYYPNGGLWQSGCGVDLVGACSHSRSYIYYVESILSGNFVAQRCDSYDDYQEGTCNGSISLMGGYDIDKSARGSFYLDTNEVSPFAKG